MPKRAIKPTPISNDQPLPLLAKSINEHHNAVQTAFEGMVLHAEAAGRDLLEAQEQVRYGAWEDWVREHTNVSPRTASNYMRIARELPKLEEENRQRTADLSLTRALEELSDGPILTEYQPKLPASEGPVLNVTSQPQADSRQLVQQCVCRFQVRRVEAFRERLVDRRQQVAGRRRFALHLPQAGERRRRPELKRLGLLGMGD